jgi:uncharacterized protein YeaO (DUF488 family)
MRDQEETASATMCVMAFEIKRIYDDAAPSDGYRALVDRLWPRGVSKERAELDEWAKDIAPSADLRAWFGHEAARFEEFAQRYRGELDANPEVERFVRLAKERDTVTLLFGAHDPAVNHAVVLRDYLRAH